MDKTIVGEGLVIIAKITGTGFLAMVWIIGNVVTYEAIIALWKAHP
jgi:hypothetical protein